MDTFNIFPGNKYVFFLYFVIIGQVFEAEKQVTKTGVIHKYCLGCNDCHCNLDASSFYNGGDGEVYIITNNILAINSINTFFTTYS